MRSCHSFSCALGAACAQCEWSEVCALQRVGPIGLIDTSEFPFEASSCGCAFLTDDEGPPRSETPRPSRELLPGDTQSKRVCMGQSNARALTHPPTRRPLCSLELARSRAEVAASAPPQRAR